MYPPSSEERTLLRTVPLVAEEARTLLRILLLLLDPLSVFFHGVTRASASGAKPSSGNSASPRHMARKSALEGAVPAMAVRL